MEKWSYRDSTIKIDSLRLIFKLEQQDGFADYFILYQDKHLFLRGLGRIAVKISDNIYTTLGRTFWWSYLDKFELRIRTNFWHTCWIKYWWNFKSNLQLLLRRILLLPFGTTSTKPILNVCQGIFWSFEYKLFKKFVRYSCRNYWIYIKV